MNPYEFPITVSTACGNLGDDQMAKKKKGKTKEKATKEGDENSALEKKIKTYITAYIDSYMDYVEELNIKEDDFPLFYTYYPFDVRAYILPDNSSCILFRGLSSATKIDLKRAEFDEVDRDISERKYDHICCYAPNHTFIKKEAKNRAQKDVEKDVENNKLLKDKEVERAEKDYALKSLRLFSVAVPWVKARESGKGNLKPPADSEAKNFEPENLKIKYDEDFSSYTNRLKSLESSFLKGEKIEVAVKTSAKATPTTTTIPVPSPGQPTNISIEIKPEALGKGEVYDEKKDFEILRLKKTLYVQTSDMEDLKRKVTDMNNKLGNMEQMRQTVFRMNRKVYDTDARMTNVEKSNREMMKKVAEMSAEQREENKKMRRFIEEKSKKARNQAMILAVIALVISIASLPFLIMLLMKFWGEIKDMMGF